MTGTKIDEEKCTGCGACIKACPNSVYVLTNGKAYVQNPKTCNPMDCVACSLCLPGGCNQS